MARAHQTHERQGQAPQKVSHIILLKKPRVGFSPGLFCVLRLGAALNCDVLVEIQDGFVNITGYIYII